MNVSEALKMLDSAPQSEKPAAINKALSQKQSTPSTNKQMVQLPELEECYKVIPFPEDEQECAYFGAGLAEMYNFIVRQQNH